MVTHSEKIHDNALILEERRERDKEKELKERERFDPDTRIFRTHVHRRSF